MRRALQTAERAFAPLARRLAREEALHWSAGAAGAGGKGHTHRHTHTHTRESKGAADCEIGERGGERGRGREGEGEGERMVMRSGNSTDDGQGGVGGVRVVVQALHRERDGGMGRRCDSGRHKFSKQKMKKVLII